MIGLTFGSVVVNSIADTSGLAMIVLQKVFNDWKTKRARLRIESRARIS